MKQNEKTVSRTFDGLSSRQLLIYARELGEHFRNERDLQNKLSYYEQRIREVVATSIRAQEEERQWIALEEVHDRIAQTMTSVFQQLQVLESITRANFQERHVVIHALALVREAIREARNIMNDLHPPALQEFGLIPLVEEEMRRLQEDMKCLTSFDIDYPVRPSWDVEVALYRIFHEAMVNIRRHATSISKVTVSLIFREQLVSLQVRDDGPGFDVETAIRSKRVGGLLSMRRRAEIIGGTFEVTSIPGQGTRLVIHIPTDSAAGKENYEDEPDAEGVAGTGGG